MQRIDANKLSKAGFVPEPLFRTLLIESAGIPLTLLLSSGVKARTKVKGIKMHSYRFTQEGAPFRLRGQRACKHGFGNGCACGYWAVRVVSELGARSMLYYAPETQHVSGLLALKGRNTNR
jgi:hypothetical protein